MSRYPTPHSILETEVAETQQIVAADDSVIQYLLGFEKDEVQSRPVKTYIRRLWLAFKSSKHLLMPRMFFDAEAGRFAKEMEAWVSDLVEDEESLAIEIAKNPVVLDEDNTKSRSVFLEDVAHTILIKREWGARLWGSRGFFEVPKANGKPEREDEEAPEWPRDQDL